MNKYEDEGFTRQNFFDEVIPVKIKLLNGGMLPEYKTKGAACFDAYANLASDKIEIPNGTRCLVPLGFAVELPHGYEMKVLPRSGGTFKGVDIGIGTIDEDYRGEVKACVINNTKDKFPLKNHERICQLKIQKAERFVFVEVDELSETERGTNGFGSTGTK